MVLFAQHADELIHDAAVDAHKLVLSTLGGFGNLGPDNACS